MFKLIFTLFLIFNLPQLHAQTTTDFNLKIKKIKGNQAQAKWKCKDTYRAYRLQIKSTSAAIWEDKILTTGDHNALINLEPNTKYQVRLAVYKNSNDGVAAYSHVVAFTTDPINEGKQQAKMVDDDIVLQATHSSNQPQIIDLKIDAKNKYFFYRILISQSPTIGFKEVLKTTTTHLSLAPLEANQTYYIKIALSMHENAPIKAYSGIVQIKTGFNIADIKPKSKTKMNR